MNIPDFGPLGRALRNSPPYPCPDLDNEWRREDEERAGLSFPRGWPRDPHRLAPGAALLLILVLASAFWLPAFWLLHRIVQ